MATGTIQPGLDSMVHCIRNAIAAKFLLVALENDLFTWLAEPKSPAEIAEHFGWLPGPTDKFCEILAYLGLIAMRGEKVRNTEQAGTLLNKASQGNVVAFLLESCKWCLEPLDHLPGVLRNGPVLPERDTDSEALWHEIVACGASMAFENSGKIVADRLASLAGADNFRRMLDLGGGHGVFSLYAAEALPDLAADVYDLPPALRSAARHIEERGFAGRVKILPGDYIREDLPNGYDLVFASCTLNFTLMDGRIQKVMDKAHAALVPGGYCVSLHDTPPDAAGKGGSYLSGDSGIAAYPVECLAFGLVSGMDMAMPEGLVAETMLQSGFPFVHSRELRTSGGTFRLDVARKGG